MHQKFFKLLIYRIYPCHIAHTKCSKFFMKPIRNFTKFAHYNSEVCFLRNYKFNKCLLNVQSPSLVRQSFFHGNSFLLSRKQNVFRNCSAPYKVFNLNHHVNGEPVNLSPFMKRKSQKFRRDIEETKAKVKEKLDEIIEVCDVGF